MKQIVLPATNTETIEINALFASTENYPFRDKMIVQVYDNKISVLMPVITPGEVKRNEAREFSLAFVEFGRGFYANENHFDACMNMRTDGCNAADVMEKMKLRIIETIRNNRHNATKFYVFDSLKDFIVAGVAHGWKS